MSLKHAILGFLSYRSNTGYDLKQGFDQSVQHFWPADQGQIYRTLNQLEKSGWVTKEVVLQEDRPNRKVYHITESGKDELQTWLSTPLSTPVNRDPFLIQVFMGGLVSEEARLHIVQKEIERICGEIEALQVLVDSQHPLEDSLNPHRFQSLLTLEVGLYLNRAYLTWLEGVVERFESGDMTLNF